jgi:hypothetical protein
MPPDLGQGWRVTGFSVQGAGHVRDGLPNQDALRWLPECGAGLPLSVAVADGHGSARCFRSDAGARSAVNVATLLLQEFLGSWDETGLSAAKRSAEESLPRELVRDWTAAVEAHFRGLPFSAAELDGLEKRDGSRVRQSVESRPLVAYGTTLLAVGVAPLFVLYLQIGDGDVIVVSEEGEVTRPLPADERLFGNETTTLCADDAWRDFRCAFQVIPGRPPALIALSTDGYANCFASERDFLQVGTDLLSIVRSGGLELVRQSLEAQLAQVSQRYSGDDITVAVLCPAADACPAAGPQRPEETEVVDHGTAPA